MAELTVIFIVETDKAVEHFVEEVDCDIHNALDYAKGLAKESGQSSSGHGVRDSEWDNAVEVAVLVGHGLNAYKQG